MAATSEDDDKPASDAQSTTEAYEGDEGESYRGEEEEEDDDDEFDETFEFDDFEDEDEFDDESDSENIDGGSASNTINSASSIVVGTGGGGFDDSGSEQRQPQRSKSAIRAAGPPPPLPPQHNFAPPFYGRPPTPLPPSPSLTSLLRPSRPTTPDPTDDELEPVPRAAPQVPTYEYYGFVLYLFSSLAFLMYLLWSYLPSPFLHALGIYYYPNRWWSLAIPSFLVMTLVYIYVALASYNTEILTLPLDSIETIVDSAAKLAAVDRNGCVVVVGGPDGSQFQGRDVTASASENSGHYSHHQHTSSRHRQPQQHGLHGADTIDSSWSAQPFHHQREPSSPSPPLGKAAWRERAGKSGRDRKARNNSASVSGGGARNAGNGSHANASEDGGLTMGARGRGRGDSLSEHPNLGHGQHGSGHDMDHSHSHGHGTSHRSPRDWNQLWNVGTDAVMDIPLAGVCEVLYA